MNLSSRDSLITRLRRGKKTREQFVDSHLARTVAHQIRAMRDNADWSQGELGEKIGSNQNAIYRYELPDYGKHTLTTLKRIAAAFDVALVVRFVPFSELVDWVSGTPRVERGLRSEALNVESFSDEFDSETHEQPGVAEAKTSLDNVPLRMAKAESQRVNAIRTSAVPLNDGNSGTGFVMGSAS